MKRAVWRNMTDEQKAAYFARERQFEAALRRRQQLEKEMREDPDGLTAARKRFVCSRVYACTLSVVCRCSHSSCVQHVHVRDGGFPCPSRAVSSK
jgi:hypothetical protein